MSKNLRESPLDPQRAAVPGCAGPRWSRTSSLGSRLSQPRGRGSPEEAWTQTCGGHPRPGHCGPHAGPHAGPSLGGCWSLAPVASGFPGPPQSWPPASAAPRLPHACVRPAEAGSACHPHSGPAPLSELPRMPPAIAERVMGCPAKTQHSPGKPGQGQPRCHGPKTRPSDLPSWGQGRASSSTWGHSGLSSLPSCWDQGPGCSPQPRPLHGVPGPRLHLQVRVPFAVSSVTGKQSTQLKNP